MTYIIQKLLTKKGLMLVGIEIDLGGVGKFNYFITPSKT